MNQRGQFSYAFVLLMLVFILVTLFVFIIPLMQNLTVSFYAGLSPVNTSIQNTIASMPDSNVKTAFSNAVTSQANLVSTNVDIMSSLVSYSGILILIIVVITLYLLARRNVETGSIG